MDASINSPIDKAATITKWCWYSSNAALKEGQAVCYNWDYGDAATTREPRRYNEVETPTTLNAQHFAGVSARAYSAKEYGQFIEIYAPGSVCNIRLRTPADVTCGVDVLTFDVTSGHAGYFRYEGLVGEGSATVLQTVDGTAGETDYTCLARLQEGEPSGGLEVVDIVDGGALVGSGTVMLFGTTLLSGADFDIAGDCTYILADGTFLGQRKKFKTLVEIVTSDFIITVTTGTESWGSGDLDTLTWAGANTNVNGAVTLVWDGAWVATHMTKTEPVPA